jgi:hypothetical protein
MSFGSAGGYPRMYKRVVDGREGYLKREKHWAEGRETVFLFDEAQTSYTDSALWADFFGRMREYPDRRAFVFLSYCSASSTIFIQGIPILIADEARIGMLPVAHDDLGVVFQPGGVRRAGQAVSSPRVPHPSLLPSADRVSHHPGTRRRTV